MVSKNDASAKEKELENVKQRLESMAHAFRVRDGQAVSCQEELAALKSNLAKAATEASCLANGIQPD